MEQIRVMTKQQIEDRIAELLRQRDYAEDQAIGCANEIDELYEVLDKMDALENEQ